MAVPPTMLPVADAASTARTSGALIDAFGTRTYPCAFGGASVGSVRCVSPSAQPSSNPLSPALLNVAATNGYVPAAGNVTASVLYVIVCPTAVSSSFAIEPATHEP